MTDSRARTPASSAAVFAAARELPERERASYVRKQLAGNDAAISEVLELLEEPIPAGFCNTRTASGIGRALEDALPDVMVGTSFHGYTIERRIGAFSGMGRVYVAREKTLERNVAIKMLPPGAMSRDLMRRFRHEVETLARLSHPHVAQLLRGDFYDDGSGGAPYIAMEYVENARNVTDFAQHHEFDLNAKLELFVRAIDAIQHGHEKGIIHRDVKPDNVLVSSDGHLKVIDFGIARSVDGEMNVSAVTVTGQVVGTRGYMSPEQADGRAADITTRSDVYSLGVVLYELLTGYRPYSIAPDVSWSGLAKEIREVPRERLSSRLPGARRDVEVVVHKAMAIEPNQRYASAADLARDLRHLIAGEPIEAEPPSVRDHLAVFARRHRLALATVAAIFVSLVVGVGVSSTLYLRTAAELRAQSRAENRHQLHESARAAISNNDTSVARSVLENVEPAERRFAWMHLAGRLDDSIWASEVDADPMLTATRDGRLVATTTYRSKSIVVLDADGNRIGEIEEPDRMQVLALVLADVDDRSILIAGGQAQHPSGQSGSFAIWDISDADAPVLVCRHVSAVQRIAALALHAERRILVTLHNTGARIWDLADPTSPTPLSALVGPRWNAQTAAFDADGRRVAIAGYDRATRVWNIDDPARPVLESVLRGQHAYIMRIAFRPGAPDQLATGANDGTIRIWDLEASRRERHEHGERAMGVTLGELAIDAGLRTVAFSQDGTLLAAAGGDRRISVWRHRRAIIWDGPERSQDWPAPGWVRYATLRGHEDIIDELVFGPDDAVYSAARDGTVRRWRAAPHDDAPSLLGHGSSVFTVSTAQTPVGVRIASGSVHVRLWDPDRLKTTAVLDAHNDMVRAVVFHPDGRLLASGDELGTVHVWNVEAAESGPATPVASFVPSWDAAGRVASLAFDPHGTWLTIAYEGGRVQRWDHAGGGVARLAAPERRQARALSCRSDGQRVLVSEGPYFSTDDDIAAGSSDRWHVFEHDLNTGRITRRFIHDVPVHAVAYAPGDRYVVTGDAHGEVFVWKRGGTQPHARRASHAGAVRSLAFLPPTADGDVLQFVTASEDRTLKLWELIDDRLQEVVTLRGHLGRVEGVATAPDGSFIASVSSGLDGRDNSVRLWETRARRLALRDGRIDRRHETEARAASVDPHTTVRSTSDGMQRAWGIVRQPITRQDDLPRYEWAMQLARTAHARQDGESAYAGMASLTIGVALLRLEHFDEAFERLSEAAERLAHRKLRHHHTELYLRQVAALAALAVAHHHRHAPDDASKALARAEDTMRRLVAEAVPLEPADDPMPHYLDLDSRALVEEARALINH